MENISLTTATWIWLMVPMPIAVVLSVLNLFLGRRENK